MGTRSYIAVQVTPSKFKAVYCHWDGYLTNNGKYLLEHYNSRGKAEALISHGGISSLGSKLGTKHSFDEKTYEETSPHYGETTFYHRDRGDELTINTHTTIKGVLKAAEQHGAEYTYVFDMDGRWLWAKRGVQYFGASDGSKMSHMCKLTKHAIALEQWEHDCYVAERDGKPKPLRPIADSAGEVVAHRDTAMRRTGGLRKKIIA